MTMFLRDNSLNRELNAKVEHAESELRYATLVEGRGPESSYVKYLRRLYLKALKDKSDRLDMYATEFVKYISPRRI